jgi:hypothetical protein
MIQREGGPTLKRGPTTDDETAVVDWANLPQGAQTEYLDASLHDAHVVSIRSDLLKRRVSAGLPQTKGESINISIALSFDCFAGGKPK